MASIIIRKLDDAIKARLRIRAAEHGRSMEEEAREILTLAIQDKPRSQENLYDAMRARLAKAGIRGVDLPQPERGPWREGADLGE
jgi:antitoxin FitA